MDRQDATPTIEKFTRRIEQPLFPCIGAKSALAQDSVEFIDAGSLLDDAADRRVVDLLQGFASATGEDAVFVSRVVIFPTTPRLNELQFERALWQRLQRFHKLDALDYSWDSSVSADPADPHFSMSLGGRGFYVIGLHPGASREARRFDCAALVFNLHSQFEALRADGRYQKLREVITDRDIAYSGSRNPMLAVHGEASEAKQYSGRRVDAEWRCPFSARQLEPVRGQ